MNDSEEFEKNAAALRELTIPPAAFAAVRQRVLSEVQAKKRLKKAWGDGRGYGGRLCGDPVRFVSSIDPPRPAAINAKKDPPKIEWTVCSR